MMINWTYEEIVLAAELVKKNEWRGMNDSSAGVVTLSEILRGARLHPFEGRDPKFRNANGVARKTWDIATQHPDYQGKKTRGNRLDSVVLNDFLADPDRMDREADAIKKALESGERPLDELEDLDVSHGEGRLLISLHVRRERNRPLRAKKIMSVRSAGKPLACEVCEFNFETFYGRRGEGYVEVHHVVPLYISGEVATRVADLALVCSNCHRMIHRIPWLTPGELRTSLSAIDNPRVGPNSDA